MPRAQTEIRSFAATLRAPNGEVTRYDVEARNRTQARREIGRIYREDTPSARNGFYAFGRMRLTWVEDAA